MSFLKSVNFSKYYGPDIFQAHKRHQKNNSHDIPNIYDVPKFSIVCLVKFSEKI